MEYERFFLTQVVLGFIGGKINGQRYSQYLQHGEEGQPTTWMILAE